MSISWLGLETIGTKRGIASNFCLPPPHRCKYHKPVIVILPDLIRNQSMQEVAANRSWHLLINV